MRVLLLLPLLLLEASAQSETWAPLRVFEGKWEGVAKGEPGKGTSTREYRFDLNSRFLVARNTSTYEPKKASEKGEVHEDLSLFSYDKAAKKFVLRQFHAEGFVNEYLLESMSADGSSMEFVTTRIENIPPGWKAKEVYRVVSKDEITESFYLAAPGKEFSLYSETHLKRVR